MKALSSAVKASEALAQEMCRAHPEPASMLKDTAVDPRQQIAVALRHCGVRTVPADADNQLSVARSNRTRHLDRRSADLVDKRLEECQLGPDMFDGAISGPVNAQSETKSTLGRDLEDGIVDEANRTDFDRRREIVGGQRRTRDRQQRLFALRFRIALGSFLLIAISHRRNTSTQRS
jgi:hypothetical protein